MTLEYLSAIALNIYNGCYSLYKPMALAGSIQTFNLTILFTGLCPLLSIHSLRLPLTNRK